MIYSSIDIDSLIQQLPTDIIPSIMSKRVIKSLKKNNFLLQEGEICQHLFKIESGICRTFRIVNETEITSGFSFAGDFDTSPTSLLFAKPSVENIQAISDVIVHIFKIEDIQQIRQESFAFDELMFLTLADYTHALEERLFEQRTLTATQRYQKLLSNHPQALQDIPLKYLASYLAISVETMSRIRKKHIITPK